MKRRREEITMNPRSEIAQKKTHRSAQKTEYVNRPDRSNKAMESERNVSLFKDAAKTQILRHLHAWLLVLISNYQASQKSSTQKMMKCNSMHMNDWVKWTYFPARRASAPVAIVEKSYFCYKFCDNGRSVGRIYSKEIVFLSAATL